MNALYVPRLDLALAIAHDARRHLAHGTTSSHLALVSTSSSIAIQSNTYEQVEMTRDILHKSGCFASLASVVTVPLLSHCVASLSCLVFSRYLISLSCFVRTCDRLLCFLS